METVINIFLWVIFGAFVFSVVALAMTVASAWYAIIHGEDKDEKW